LTATIEHAKIKIDGTPYLMIPALIEKTTLGYEDHGIMLAWLHLDYTGSAQGAGGYVLDTYDEEQGHRVGSAYGLDWIIRVLKVVGVDEWESVPRHRIYALKTTSDWGPIDGIASISKPDKNYLIFEEHAELWKEKG
jgi:hypothetical protein